MRGFKFNAWSPLEVGDCVMATVDGDSSLRVVEDILVTHSGATGDVSITYMLSDVPHPVKLDCMAYRVVDGKAVAIGRERGGGEEVAV